MRVLGLDSLRFNLANIPQLAMILGQLAAMFRVHVPLQEVPPDCGFARRADRADDGHVGAWGRFGILHCCSVRELDLQPTAFRANLVPNPKHRFMAGLIGQSSHFSTLPEVFSDVGRQTKPSKSYQRFSARTMFQKSLAPGARNSG